MTKTYCEQCDDSENIDYNSNQGKYNCRHGKDWYQEQEDQRKKKIAENGCRSIKKIRERTKNNKQKDKIRIQLIRDQHRTQKEGQNSDIEAIKNKIISQARDKVREYLLKLFQWAPENINVDILPYAALLSIANTSVGGEIAAILIANPQVLAGAVLITGILAGLGFFLNQFSMNTTSEVEGERMSSLQT
ncbi:UNKNOWN [Stylonychia lemnae]|uniref:Uncharacterized protein n=1 Tax=Stylonychia lemnae TaxID=5949 RepID=A0A078ALB3_STYLE|nr:UNKNOWN [Stylonychia lemnae]|eukprot:CDW81653.1 UNKNOWN [Stylonychia lemnae]